MCSSDLSSSGWRCKSLTTRLFWRSTRNCLALYRRQDDEGGLARRRRELFQVAEQQDVNGTEVVRVDGRVRASAVIYIGENLADAGKTYVVQHGHLVQQKHLELDKRSHLRLRDLCEIELARVVLIEIEQIVDSRGGNLRALDLYIRGSYTCRRRRFGVQPVHETPEVYGRDRKSVG